MTLLSEVEGDHRSEEGKTAAQAILITIQIALNFTS